MGANQLELSGDGALGASSFGKYRLIASLGQGGMANVYLAVVLGPAGFNKLLVVKALREDVLGNSDEFVHMFLDEARLSARLNHPNIVQTYEIGQADGRYFIAMEFLEGQPLRVAQRRLGPVGLPLEEELRIIAETARGLHYVHELKGLSGESLEVIHRDVSPQNIFLTYEGRVKLLDFGIAKTRDAEHLTKVGVIKGKLDYIAPEQIRGEKIDRRADVFALGVMLWEAATGQRFAGGSKVQDVTKLHRRLTGGEAKLKDVKPDLPDQLAFIIQRATALDPNERHASAAVLADEIDAFLEQFGMRPSPKTLSGRLGAPFSAERAKIAWLIDEQVKLALESGAERALPSIGRSELSQSHSGVRANVEASDRSQDILVSRGAAKASLPPPGPHAESASHSLAPAMATKVHAQAAAGAHVATSPVLAAQSALEPVQGTLGSRWLKGALVAAALLGASFLAIQAQRDAAAEADASSAAEAGRRKRSFEVEANVHVNIFVLPAFAEAKLDDVPLTTLPFAAEVPRDGKLHHVEASAPGYRSKNVVVTFDRDREVSIVLDKLPPEGPMPRPKRREAGAARESHAESADNESEDATDDSEAPRQAVESKEVVAPTPAQVVQPAQPNTGRPQPLANPYE